MCVMGGKWEVNKFSLLINKLNKLNFTHKKCFKGTRSVIPSESLNKCILEWEEKVWIKILKCKTQFFFIITKMYLSVPVPEFHTMFFFSVLIPEYSLMHSYPHIHPDINPYIHPHTYPILILIFILLLSTNVLLSRHERNDYIYNRFKFLNQRCPVSVRGKYSNFQFWIRINHGYLKGRDFRGSQG